MSTLFQVGHLATRVEPYRFDPSCYADAGYYRPLRRDGESDEAAYADGHAWIVDRLPQASETALHAVVAEHVSRLATDAPSVEKALRCFESGADPAAALVRGTEDADLFMLTSLLELASILHEARPDRFAPLTLARVELDVDGIHPDVREFTMYKTRAAHVLRDSSDTHPLRAFGEGVELASAIVAVDSTLTRISDDELRTGAASEALIAEHAFYRRECVVWLPPRFEGDIRGRFWSSSAPDDA